MPKTHICESCNYSTYRYYDYNKHLHTKKHIKNIQNTDLTKKYEFLLSNFTKKQDNDTLLKTKNKKQCKYCQKYISYSNFSKHLRICNKYQLYHFTEITNEKTTYLTKELQRRENEIISLKIELDKRQKIIKNKDNSLINLTNKFNNIIVEQNKSKNNKKRKYTRHRKIPATVRNTIWKLHMGDENESKCCCCNIEPITKGNFECGHIISHVDGGKIQLDNLRPICGLCNKSMSTMNMIDFMKQYGYNIDHIQHNM